MTSSSPNYYFATRHFIKICIKSWRCVFTFIMRLGVAGGGAYRVFINCSPILLSVLKMYQGPTFLILLLSFSFTASSILLDLFILYDLLTEHNMVCSESSQEVRVHLKIVIKFFNWFFVSNFFQGLRLLTKNLF